MTESELQQSVRITLGRERDLVLWRNHVGAANVDGRVRRFGLCVGSADLVGIGPGGRFIGLEIKTPRGRVSEEQQRFLELVQRRGGFAAVVPSVEDAYAAIAAARCGEVGWTPSQIRAA